MPYRDWEWIEEKAATQILTPCFREGMSASFYLSRAAFRDLTLFLRSRERPPQPWPSKQQHL